MIKITIPNNNIAERQYIIDVIFNEFLGVDYKLEIRNTIKGNWEIELKNGRKLIIEDHFFNKHISDLEYLKLENIPQKIEYTKNEFTPENNIPIIFGNTTLNFQDSILTCGIDIFASSFFMLTRWEEYVNKTRDIHDRFPATASLAYKNGFLDRPIVNEYVEMLWNMLKYLGCNFKRKDGIFELMITHDVDNIFSFINKPFFNKIKNIGADIILRKDFNAAFNKFISFFYNDIYKKAKYDNFFTFEYIMNQSDKRNIKSNFYFIPKGSFEQKFKYDISKKFIIDLIKSILLRGHNVGIHGSYETYNDKEKFIADLNYFNKILEFNDIKYQIKGGRQHYLRFKIPETFYNYEDASLEYDATLSYADIAGFRCGTCYKFSPFDFLRRKKLNIKEIPLIVMDGTINNPQYMGLGYNEQGLRYIKNLKDKCRKYNGIFCLLWHNSELKNKKEKEFYENVLDC